MRLLQVSGIPGAELRRSYTRPLELLQQIVDAQLVFFEADLSLCPMWLTRIGVISHMHPPAGSLTMGCVTELGHKLTEKALQMGRSERVFHVCRA